MEEEEEAKCECPAGIPAWVMTFADLMSLLMCFFVLLLSFAEMDIQKFKQLKGSLTEAFGVQTVIPATEIPKGTSVVAEEFSSAPPRPTIINEVRQVTQNEVKETLEYNDALEDFKKDKDKDYDKENDKDNDNNKENISEQTAKDSIKLQAILSEEIDKGLVEIETQSDAIIIRISEKASFPSGAAKLRSGFLPVVAKLREALAEVQGMVVVAGHTDNRPIKTARFRSNWDLSASRAVSVVHELLLSKTIPSDRFIVEGHGDAHPIVANDSRDNRAKNRRVELSIKQENKNDQKSDRSIFGDQSEGETSPTDDPLDELNLG